jgi:hypothetical protein
MARPWPSLEAGRAVGAGGGANWLQEKGEAVILIFGGRWRSTVCADGPRHEATGGQMVLRGRWARREWLKLGTPQVLQLSGLIGPGSRRSFLLRLQTSVGGFRLRRSRPQEVVAQ